MAKYCSQCGAKISFRNSFTVNKQPVCGTCMIERIASGGKASPKNKVKKVSVKPEEDVKKTKVLPKDKVKNLNVKPKDDAKKVEVLPKDKVKTADKRKRDEHSEKKQKSLGWVAITGCIVPSVTTGIVFSGYDLKGLIPLIAFAIYLLLFTLLTGTIIWSVEKFMKLRRDYSIHKMHFVANFITIIAVTATILFALYLSQGELITKRSTFEEKLLFAAIILLVAYFSYITLFSIDRYKFRRKQKKEKSSTA
jgi:cation transport ATPase